MRKRQARNRVRILTLATIACLLAGTVPTASASPETEDFGAVMRASPKAEFQVSTNGTDTRVTVDKGSLYVKTYDRNVTVFTADGVVALDSGEAIVTATSIGVTVKVTQGRASLNSPYITAGNQERLPPYELSAGEVAEGRMAGPEEEQALQALGLDE